MKVAPLAVPETSVDAPEALAPPAPRREAPPSKAEALQQKAQLEPLPSKVEGQLNAILLKLDHLLQLQESKAPALRSLPVTAVGHHNREEVDLMSSSVSLCSSQASCGRSSKFGRQRTPAALQEFSSERAHHIAVPSMSELEREMSLQSCCPGHPTASVKEEASLSPVPSSPVIDNEESLSPRLPDVSFHSKPPRATSLAVLNAHSQGAILRTAPMAERLSTIPRATCIHWIARHPRWVCAAVGLLTLCQVVAAVGTASTGRTPATNTFTLVSTVLYAFLAFCSQLLLQKVLHGADFLVATTRLCISLEELPTGWQARSRSQQGVYASLGCLIVGIFVTTQVLQAWLDESEALDDWIARGWTYAFKGFSVLAFSLSCLVVLYSTYIQAHYLIGLDSGLDCWCFRLVDSLDYSTAVLQWNALQAVLKTVSREMAPVFLVTQCTAFFGSMYFIIAGLMWIFQNDSFEPWPLAAEGLSSLPLMFLLLLSMRLCSAGADLTAKCQGIPAFVNQTSASEALSTDRQYLIRYVDDSSAGFVIKDVKLTRELFMKEMVIFAGTASALVTLMSRIYL